MCHRVLIGLVLASAAAMACGGSNNPTGPSTPTPPGGSTQSCRNSASSVTSVAVAGSFRATSTSSCAFNTSTRIGSCTILFSDSNGMTSTSTGVITFASLADFVDEVAVVPPLTKSLQSTGTGPSGTGTVVHTYDAQGRLTRILSTSASGQVTTTTHSAWDAAGRPTNARDVGPGFDNTRQISYDDAARTRTIRVVGLDLVTTETFDANGNPVSNATIAGGMTTTVTTFTTNSIQRVCK